MSSSKTAKNTVRGVGYLRYVKGDAWNAERTQRLPVWAHVCSNADIKNLLEALVFEHARGQGELGRKNQGDRFIASAMRGLEFVQVEQSEPERSSGLDDSTKARIAALEKEITELRAQKKSSDEAGTAATIPVVTAALPPPSTYAEAVRREFNRAKHAEARADKLNRAKMAAVSQAAADIRRKEKEAALREKFKEGYVPLAVRQDKQRIASEAKSKKPAHAVQKTAQAAHTFVRFTRAQMREHQLAVLKATGADHWFSAAERAAYKALSPARKAELKRERIVQREKAEAAKAAERQRFREERAERVAALTKARVEALAKSTPKQRYSGNDRLRSTKGRESSYCTTGHRLVTNDTGTAQRCRDCGYVPVPE